jgi:hypothetical protein
MGFLQNTPEELAAKAKKAYGDGRQRFIARLISLSGGKDNEVESWSRHIEAIEEIGWVVDHFSVASNEKGWSEAYVLFKRQ